MTIEIVKKIYIYLVVVGSVLHSVEPLKEASYVLYTKEIMNPFIDECEKNYQLECIGTGGRFAYNVAGINITFVAYRKGTIEESRKLEVSMTEKLLSEINSSEKIRPFLVEYPFKSTNIDISLSFQKADDSNYTDGSVVHAFHAKDKLFYSSEDPKTGKLVRILEEPYEEAKKIVNSGK